MEHGALKQPGSRILMRSPNKMFCSLSNDMVQNGRTKSWWSMCGGMHSSCQTCTSFVMLIYGLYVL